MITAVLFDFDGVIANTLSFHIEAWRQILKPLGIDLTAEEVAVEEGANAREIIGVLLKRRNISLTAGEIKELTDRKHERYRQITQARIYPETLAFIKALESKPLKLALVTGSIIPMMVTVTGKEFLDNFHAIITSDDVQKNKPDPEPYLRAAEKLRVAPSECLVIENAPKGIQAAKAAGMFCIALKTTIRDDVLLKGADLIVDHLSAIDPEAIERLNE